MCNGNNECGKSTAFDNAITGTSVGISITYNRLRLRRRGMGSVWRYLPCARSLPGSGSEKLSHLLDVLISAAGHVDNYDLVTRYFLCVFYHIGNCMSRFECRDDAFRLR